MYSTADYISCGKDDKTSPAMHEERWVNDSGPLIFWLFTGFCPPPSPSPPPTWDNELELEETPEARCFRADDGLSETPCPGVQKLDKMTREQIFSRLCHSQTFIVEHTCYVREKTQQDMVL